ncbi:MAG: dihydrodipicolinate synthase family protein, partial [Bacteroidaceae bacterium]|nr:dihydrodipicolinate synthase family protein [Bacteroidaceae bacterium]
MDASKFRGVIPPVVVPLKSDRTLDVKSLEKNLNRMIEAGVNGLFFMGSSGEVAFLTDEQRKHVLLESIAIVDG